MQTFPVRDLVARARLALRISTRSIWSDQVWHLDGVRPGGNRSDFSLDWGFTLADDSRFSDLQWSDWREAAKLFLWSLKLDPPPGRRNVHESTVVRVFNMERTLIRWMIMQGYRRFADLDRDGCERFLAAMAQRPGAKPGRTVTIVTLQHYANLLRLLYLQGSKYPEVAIEDPFPGMTPPFVRRDRGWLPYTPDAVAVALVSAALRLIGPPADDVIALQALAQATYDDALARGISQTKAGFIVTDAIAPFVFTTLPGEDAPWHDAPVTSTKQVRYLCDRIYDACFVVIAYLVGARVSEILGLQVGCIEQHPAGDGSESFAYLIGQIYKTARGADGEAHRWVAPAPVERAIVVVEQLTTRLRAQTGRSELFLVMASTGLVGPSPRVELPVLSTVIRRLNDLFAPFIGLPDHEGETWHLNTHQGRKTFARFVGKRDRTSLHALQAHFGHITRAMTDRGYVGTDFALDELIDRHAQEETRAALEEVLTATALAGKGGRMIAARSQFRGRTRDGDVQAYVRFLMEETDLRLGVCDWGYCVYRVETAACLGDERGPNPVLRTESTCLTCANFAVTARHRPVWQARRDRNADLLDQSGLDRTSRSLAKTRVAECHRILAELDHGKDAADGL
ncbi:integrase [Agrobacterium tumefaciens]|uniref:integrase n=1 Tax=Agrobacterium tumefaciens TaxID=358 RepID=UPI0021CE4F14|nr:integrase [Agrobacterium tumefaciens]UXS49652.1 integrase [Agrobacterium tumefaciens]UXS50953.1 integrase [Agrobacterium tumefaciens]